MIFDLASLAKPLVTAPLALRHLDLDRDRRAALGFAGRREPLTVRQLLAHAAGLPAWLPFTGEPLARQLERGWPAQDHPKLAPGRVGVCTYSDLGYRLLADLLEAETGQAFPALGAAASGLLPAPWSEPPTPVPPGPDRDFWALAAPGLPFPEPAPGLPHDANARAGMRGHAGFAADPARFQACLEAWAEAGWPRRMAQDQARGADGSRWGLGLQRAFRGPGRFGTLLDGIPLGRGGVHVLVRGGEAGDPPPMASGPAGEASGFWYHLGFTGPALFYRPEDGLLLGILAHRRGPGGGILDPDALQARRWAALQGWMADQGFA
ncbi:serine hydrolase [Mesoterricola sediminis]|uniref:Beta-lactamase-related domain-containing protein n=1 Tax=Mesoterricola sediminis TaxID=2927980 RepID=A0AA48H2W5_9BACT|nr:serine hydrolase domain-containing protein [Mesoterricola sediminis]BDU76486.1 hypothetical protein METESE_14440 [Mesoterricola sediminis]